MRVRGVESRAEAPELRHAAVDDVQNRGGAVAAQSTPPTSTPSSRRSASAYNNSRLHAGIGSVNPADEHAGRGPKFRHARRLGLQRARDARLAYHRNHKNRHNP